MRKPVWALAGLAAVAGTERYLVRRARSRPDPERRESLAERPEEGFVIRSFDGTELAVSVAGPINAPTLVFCHGLSLDMTSWHYQWKALSRDFRCVLFDQRGHGRSSQPGTEDYSLNALAHDLSAVLDETAPDGSVVLIGHSLGGMSIMALASGFPEEFGDRIAGVVLANTAASDVVKEFLGVVGVRAAALVRPYAHRLKGVRSPVGWAKTRLGNRAADLEFLIARVTNFGRDAPPSLVEHVARTGAGSAVSSFTYLMRSLIDFIDLDLSDALEQIKVPTLIITGDVDRITPPSSALAINRRLPDGRLVVLQGAGHCAMLERHEQFNEVIDEFVRQILRLRAEKTPA